MQVIFQLYMGTFISTLTFTNLIQSEDKILLNHKLQR